MSKASAKIQLSGDGDGCGSNREISGVTGSEMRDLVAEPPPTAPFFWTSAPAMQQLLVAAAAAIVDDNFNAACEILTNLGRCRCDAITESVAGALFRRISLIGNGEPSPVVASLCSMEHMEATQELYRRSPCHRAGIRFLDTAVLDALRGCPEIHILDFDFGDGTHYYDHLLTLKKQHRRVRITAVVDPGNLYAMNTIAAGWLREAGARVATAVGQHASFHVAEVRGPELSRAAVSCGDREAVAARLPYVLARVADESVTPENPRCALLRALQWMAPRVVGVAEEEMNGNTARLEVRTGEAWGFYAALWESMAGGMSARVEGCLRRRVENALREDGGRRVERCEVFSKWTARMQMAGYTPVDAGPADTGPAVRPRDVGEAARATKVLWRGRIMVVVSMWR